MDLKALVRDKITNTVLLHAHSSHSWRILIIHEHTAQILTNLYTKGELILHDIFNYQSLSDSKRSAVPDHPAIYFLRPEKAAFKLILKDIKNKFYSRFTVFFTCEPESNPGFEYKVINIDFICVEKHVFTCSSESLKYVANVTKHNFFVNYYGDAANLAKQVEADFNINRKGELIIMKRSADLVSPLMRFFTFECLLRDFKICEEFDVNSTLWHKIRYLHVRDVNVELSREAAFLNEDIKKLEQVGTKDLLKMVYEAPEKIQLKEEVCRCLDWLDLAITRFEKENLNFVSLTEQNIVYKRLANGQKYTTGVDDFFKICKDKRVDILDKKRLYLLLCLSGYDFQKNEDSELLNLGIIEKEDVILKNKIAQLRKNNVIMSDREYKYDLSRFKPLIYHLLKDFVDTNKLITSVSDKKTKTVESLRKSEFIFTKATKIKRLICIYVVGGITYEEIKIVSEFSKSYGIDIIIGSECILDYKTFLGKIKDF